MAGASRPPARPAAGLAAAEWIAGGSAVATALAAASTAAEPADADRSGPAGAADQQPQDHGPGLGSLGSAVRLRRRGGPRLRAAGAEQLLNRGGRPDAAAGGSPVEATAGEGARHRERHSRTPGPLPAGPSAAARDAHEPARSTPGLRLSLPGRRAIGAGSSHGDPAQRQPRPPAGLVDALQPATATQLQRSDQHRFQAHQRHDRAAAPGRGRPGRFDQ